MALSSDKITGRRFFYLESPYRSGDRPVFDAIELAPVADVDRHGTVQPFESLDDIPEALHGFVYWSLYGHTRGEGLHCIGDFDTAEQALEVLERLIGDLREL